MYNAEGTRDYLERSPVRDPVSSSSTVPTSSNASDNVVQICGFTEAVLQHTARQSQQPRLRQTRRPRRQRAFDGVWCYFGQYLPTAPARGADWDRGGEARVTGFGDVQAHTRAYADGKLPLW